MATWSARRKIFYAFLAIVLALVVVGIPAYKLFYTAPTCTDKTENGDEQGIDCGGSCTKLCSSAFLPLPQASWVRFREVAPQTYNIAAYVVNPNPKAAAKAIPYTFTFLDAQGIALARKTGTFVVPAGRNTLVFDGPIVVRDQKPVRISFEFNQNPDWYVATDPLIPLAVTDKKYAEQGTAPGGSSALDVSIKNTGALRIAPFDVFALLKDDADNVIDFSKTIVDGVGPGSTITAPFTWPYIHDHKVISIEVLTVPE